MITLLTVRRCERVLCARVRCCSVWNVTHGFDLIGEPASLWPSINASCNEPQRMNSTIFLGANNWHCVGCGTDQGALFYIFHVLRHGAYRQTDGSRSDVQVAHWWAHPKPWEVCANTGSSSGHDPRHAPMRKAHLRVAR